MEFEPSSVNRKLRLKMIDSCSNDQQHCPRVVFMSEASQSSSAASQRVQDKETESVSVVKISHYMSHNMRGVNASSDL